MSASSSRRYPRCSPSISRSSRWLLCAAESQVGDHLPHRRDEPGPAVTELEQATLRGDGDFLDVG
jgi:hypothetical protein